MMSGTKAKLDQGLIILPQIEQDLRGQTGQIYKALQGEPMPLTPSRLAIKTDIPAPSVRRALGTLKRAGLVKMTPLNEYSIK